MQGINGCYSGGNGFGFSGIGGGKRSNQQSAVSIQLFSEIPNPGFKPGEGSIYLFKSFPFNLWQRKALTLFKQCVRELRLHKNDVIPSRFRGEGPCVLPWSFMELRNARSLGQSPRDDVLQFSHALLKPGFGISRKRQAARARDRVNWRIIWRSLASLSLGLVASLTSSQRRNPPRKA